MWYYILANKILLTLVLAGLVSQGLKLLLTARKRRLSRHDLFVTGGMPSSHAALTVSLTTIIFLFEGLSTSFFISAVLMAIVIRDATGVRRTVGEEVQIINKVLKKGKIRAKHLQEMRGHTPLEVLVGAVIGVASAILIFLF